MYKSKKKFTCVDGSILGRKKEATSLLIRLFSSWWLAYRKQHAPHLL